MDAIRAVKGTADILPGEIETWQRIEAMVREITARFGYSEIRTPVFEETGLFARSIGEDTDIVGKEMYSFTDKGGRDLTLRPEGTASVVRALIEHRLDQRGLPQKLWYMGPMFRQERPQKGRQRQFHQFGVEAVGSSSPFIDAEVIVLFDRIAAALGLGERTVSVNSIGGPESRERYRIALNTFLDRVGDRLCEDCIRRRRTNPLRVLDCKVPACREAIHGVADLPKTVDHLTAPDRDHYEQVKAALAAADVPYIENPYMVRGLDYYTGTVFEVNLSTLGAQSAVMGGGRYDRLIAELGGPDLPAVGFACGMERLALALSATGSGQDTAGKAVKVFVAVPQPILATRAYLYVMSLRNDGIVAEMENMDRSMKAQMKAADRFGADYVIIPEEEHSELVSVKNMKTSEQEKTTYTAFRFKDLQL